MIFNKRLRTERGSTSIGAAITGAVASIGLVATGVVVSSSIIPEDINTSSSGVCVKAYYSDDESIAKTDCVYLNSQAGVTAPGGNNPTPEEGEEEENQSDSVYAKYECGPNELVVFQSEIDHSNKNKELLAEGKADEMTPYPGDNWKIIFDVSDLDPSLKGVMYTTDGELGGLTFKNTTRNDAASVVLNLAEDYCIWGSTKDGNPHSYRDDGLASYDRNGGSGTDAYFKNGVPTRENDLPTVVRYGTDSEVSQEQYAMDQNANSWHRTTGPAITVYKESGEVDYFTYYINNEIISDRDDWISKGGTPAGWDNYDQSLRIDY